MPNPYKSNLCDTELDDLPFLYLYFCVVYNIFVSMSETTPGSS